MVSQRLTDTVTDQQSDGQTDRQTVRIDRQTYAKGGNQSGALDCTHPDHVSAGTDTTTTLDMSQECCHKIWKQKLNANDLETGPSVVIRIVCTHPRKGDICTV